MKCRNKRPQVFHSQNDTWHGTAATVASRSSNKRLTTPKFKTQRHLKMTVSWQLIAYCKQRPRGCTENGDTRAAPHQTSHTPRLLLELLAAAKNEEDHFAMPKKSLCCAALQPQTLAQW